MASNILINSKVEIGSGFKATVIMLWTSGTIIYFRDDTILWESDGYFSVLTLSATVFALILAFRISRVLSTTSDEDQRFMKLVHQFELLIDRKVIQAEAETVFRDLYSIDTTPHAHEIEPVYHRLRSLMRRSRSALSSARSEQAEISALEADLHIFVNSKQQPWNFGEFFALCTFALLTVALALFQSSQIHGWTAFLLEMFIVPFCAVIVFLIFNAWDLQRNRYRPILVEQNGRYTLHFHEDEDRRVERIISVLVSIGIWLAFAYVFATSWL